uniref:Abasic site processing protein HMCES n=1 Tax=Eptatretus burgeri TaxID=7764 RepID=A0A8C4N324_EPTBU
MCGRTACTLGPEQVQKHCTYRRSNGCSARPQWWKGGVSQYQPSYNKSPHSTSPVLLSKLHFDKEADSSEQILMAMRWGLVPSWFRDSNADNSKYNMSNCRSESLQEKKTFKVPFMKGQRCVVLADGFYEWKTNKNGKKQPYFIYFSENQVLKGKDMVKKMTRPEGIDVENQKEEVKKEVLKTEFGIESQKQQLKKEELTTEGAIKSEKEELTTEGAIKSEKEELTTEGAIKNEKEELTTEGAIKSEKEELTTEGGIESQEEEVKNVDVTLKLESDCVEEKKPKTEEFVEKIEGKSEAAWQLLTMAGLFDCWKQPGGEDLLYTYTVITVPASPKLTWLHHRMPAILHGEESVRQWLDFGAIPGATAFDLLCSSESIAWHPVSTVVNNARNNLPECVVPFVADLQKVTEQAPTSSGIQHECKRKMEEKSKKKANSKEGVSQRTLHSWLEGSGNSSNKKVPTEEVEPVVSDEEDSEASSQPAPGQEKKKRKTAAADGGYPWKVGHQDTMAEFWLNHPIFYDKTQQHYKNKEMKIQLMKDLIHQNREDWEKIHSPLPTVAQVEAHLRNMRTRFVKLAKRKSGAPALTLSYTDQKILDRYKFLRPHIQRNRTTATHTFHGVQPGVDADDDEGDDDDDDDDDGDDDQSLQGSPQGTAGSQQGSQRPSTSQTQSKGKGKGKNRRPLTSPTPTTVPCIEDMSELEILQQAKNLISNIRVPTRSEHERRIRDFSRYMESEMIRVPEASWDECSYAIMHVIRGFKNAQQQGHRGGGGGGGGGG